MKTQSVVSQGTNLFGSAAGSVGTKVDNAGGGFNLMMDSNLKSLQTSLSSKGASVPKVQKVDKNSAIKVSTGKEAADASSMKNGQVKLMKAKDGNSADVAGTAKDTKLASQIQSEAVTQTKDEPAVDEEVLAQIMSMLQSVQTTVMQQLNLTTEDFNQLLSDQGMGLSDLLQPENLQQFILASNGQADISAVLTDENLAAAMKNLMSSIDGLKTDANLGLSEEQLQQLLKQAQAKDDTDSLLTLAGQEQLPGTVSLKEQASAAEVEGTNADNKEATPKVTINNESGQADSSANTVSETKESFQGNQEDESRNEQRDLKAADQFQAFIDNMVKTTQELRTNFDGGLTQVTELRDIANQILNRIKLSVSPNQSSMELQLNPEHLGKVNLTVHSKDGVMTAQFMVQNELSKEAIESQLHVLRESLNSQGVKVEAIEVTVTDYAFEQNPGQDAGNHQEAKESNTSKKLSLEDALSMSETLEESSMISPEAIGLSGSQINYTA